MDRKSLGYLPSHEWVQIEGAAATIGITQFAVEQLTDLILIELPTVGSKITAGKSFGEVESVKAVSDLYCAGQWRSDRGQQQRHVQRAGSCRGPF